jgi:hypothetical protein
MNNKNNNVVGATLRTATQVIAILAVILVTFISCGKGDNEGSVSNKDLIGTWLYESATIDGKNSIDIVFDTVKISKRLLGDCYKKNKIIFTDKEIVIYKYSLNQKTNQCEEEWGSVSYVLSGNTLVIKGEGGAGSLNISIVGNKLMLKSIFNSQGIEDLKPLDGKRVVETYRKL